MAAAAAQQATTPSTVMPPPHRRKSSAAARAGARGLIQCPAAILALRCEDRYLAAPPYRCFNWRGQWARHHAVIVWAFGHAKAGARQHEAPPVNVCVGASGDFHAGVRTDSHGGDGCEGAGGASVCVAVRHGQLQQGNDGFVVGGVQGRHVVVAAAARDAGADGSAFAAP